MNRPEPTWATLRPAERLADTPAVRRNERWWLVTPSGAVPADEPSLARELDLLAADMDAANRAVAQLGRDESDRGLG
ncbi:MULTISPECIES: hypothetical protein [unclassified Streptomyces]|uniref:hypothetical protein n=1 Tax=unclassified Streptomyces TaxID=2593676 RepID=UPI002DDA6FE4|nr:MULTISPECIES: hypothetical protein [unclassified Streptomyces]WSA96691.1 hypothetical protein OIE63_37940 [Streptomyces sp. NBC_01795]WSB81106.1 hypothetical protein OHB04_39060 [Streptomyces sp. NBC_01775]WSS10682.1 hypothetical protein OG533_01200 [Streptomyces sp. NBC_01186]WSS39379.1 hypothetical protein OG220_01225 [Streptomyces sp. NBC_01187]